MIIIKKKVKKKVKKKIKKEDEMIDLNNITHQRIFYNDYKVSYLNNPNKKLKNIKVDA